VCLCVCVCVCVCLCVCVFCVCVCACGGSRITFHMNESCHWNVRRTSLVPALKFGAYEWVMSHINQSCLLWMRRVTYKRNKSRTHMRHVPICSGVRGPPESCHTCEINVTRVRWISHMWGHLCHVTHLSHVTLMRPLESCHTYELCHTCE